MADPYADPEDDPTAPAFALPPRAGSGTFLGMQPSAWLAALGGLLSGVRVGNPQTVAHGGGLRPGLALFPLAQGLETGDQRSRQDAAVQGLAAKYGGQNPEYDAALETMVQDPSLGSKMLFRAISANNQERRDTRRDTILQARKTAEEVRAGRAAKEAGALFRDVPELAAAPDALTTPGTGEFLRPPTMPSPLALRPRTTDELARGMESLPDDAAKLVLPTLTARSQEAAKPRDPTVVRLAIQAAQGSQAAQAALDRLPQSQKSKALTQTDLAMQATGTGPEAERAKRALDLLRPEKERTPTSASLAVAAVGGDAAAAQALERLQRPTTYQSVEEQVKLEGLTPGTLAYAKRRNDLLRQVTVPEGGAVYGMGSGLQGAPQGAPVAPPKPLIQGPQKPIADTAAVRVSGAESASQAISRLEQTMKSPGVQKYQGPAAQWWATIQRNTPGAALGEISPQKIDFDQDLSAIRNHLLQLRSGAQVTTQEAARLENELPKASSRPVVFARELENTKRNVTYLERRLQELVLRGDPRAMQAARELGMAEPDKPKTPANTTPSPGGWKRVPE